MALEFVYKETILQKEYNEVESTSSEYKLVVSWSSYTIHLS